jgi:mono/diheme cytochrome c family protein
MNSPLTALLVVLAMAFLATASSASAADPAAGAILFNANCSSCHGVSGKGDGPVGAVLQPPPRDFTVGEFVFDPSGNGVNGEDEDLRAVIENGAMKFGGSPLMAPWPTLTDEQVADIIAHIRSLKVEGAPEAATEAAPAE